VKAKRKSGVAFAPGSGCESPVVKVDILDVSEDPIVSLIPDSNTACDANFEGSIQVNITEVPATPGVGQQYVYDWSSTTTTTPADNGLPLPGAGPYAGVGVGNENLTSLEDGFYTLTAYNNLTGCSSTDTKEIIRNQTPVVILQATPTNQNLCFPSGSVLVQSVSLDGAAEPPAALSSDYDYTWSTDVGQLATVGDTDLDLDVVDLPTIGAGSYYVKAKRKSGVAFAPGSGCESPVVKVDILDVSEDPIVSLIPDSNTACDANFEGSIQVNITEVPATPGVGQQYVYDWSSTTTTTPADNGLPLPGAGPYAGVGAGNENLTSLEDGFYTLTAYNNLTGCSSTDTKEIVLSETPIVVVQLSVTDQQLCAPPDGQINVTDVTVDGTTDAANIATNYTYTWYQGDLSTVIAGQTGVSLTGRAFGGYYVKAKRNNGLVPGSGCESSPVRVDIADRTKNPIVTYLLQENTACDGNFDGSITVLSSDQPGPGLGSNYDISWPVVPAGNSIAPANNVGASYTTTAADVIGPNTFTVQVINRATQCATSAQIVMTTKEEPLEILTITTQDQDICYPDGTITVSSLNTGGVIDYSFEWYRNDVNSSKLVDNAAAIITNSVLQPGNAAGQYPTMGAGTYYVIATKNPGMAPGSGCKTPPFRADIFDLHVDPVAQLSYTPNSSCDLVNPNGIVLATAAEANGANTDTYSFSWTLGGAALPATSTVTNTSNGSTVTDAADGLYVLTVTNVSGTGCSSDAGIQVTKDLNLSIPNIIDVTTVDPIDCLPSARADVTRISIGGTTFYNSPPDDLDAAFDYEWYKTDFQPSKILPGEINRSLVNITVDKYYVIVKDLTTACKSNPKEVVINDDNIVYPVVAITQTAKQISCVNPGTAALFATGDGQSASPYTFQWFSTLDLTGPASANTTANLTNLSAGDYSVNVTNTTTGCASSAFYIVPDEADLFRPIISFGGAPRTLCVGQNGTALVEVVNLSPDYPLAYNFTSDLYLGTPTISTDPFAVPPVPNFPNMPGVPGFVGTFLQPDLAEGTYSARLVDNNTGCVVTIVGEVKDGRVNPVVKVTEENPLINCDPNRANGQLSATADDRVIGFTFDWYDGASVPTPPGTPLEANTDLLIGYGVYGQDAKYTVRATNNITGCFGDGTGTITDGTVEPPLPAPEVVFHRTNCITPNGWVTVTVDGSTLYTFNWYDGATASGSPDFTDVNYQGLDAGDYSVTATDEITGCVSPAATVKVEDRRLIPEFTIVSTPSFCIDTGRPKGNGTVLLEVTNEAILNDVQWYDLNSGANVASGTAYYELWPGKYRAEVVTNEGCENEGETEVGTEIAPYNGISNNGDNQNDFFIIDCITNFPNNNVKIYNRSGILVYEQDGYNNADLSFKGIGERGLYLQGINLPVGTYFYIIDKRDGSKPVAGYLELDR
jgi:hypothetical protein